MSSFGYDFNGEYTLDGMVAINVNLSDALSSPEAICERSLAHWSSGASDAYRTSKQTWDSATADVPEQLVNPRRTTVYRMR
jgi:hypothetical protein